MFKNVGNFDRLIRFVFAAVFAWLYFNDIVSPALGYVLMVLSLVFLITALLSYCPIYQILGLSGCSADSKKREK